MAGGWQKIIDFNLKFYFYLREENKEGKLCEGSRDISLDLLYMYLLVIELCFDMMLYLAYIPNILMLVILNNHAGRIWPSDHAFSIPD